MVKNITFIIILISLSAILLADIIQLYINDKDILLSKFSEEDRLCFDLDENLRNIVAFCEYKNSSIFQERFYYIGAEYNKKSENYICTLHQRDYSTMIGEKWKIKDTQCSENLERGKCYVDIISEIQGYQTLYNYNFSKINIGQENFTKVIPKDSEQTYISFRKDNFTYDPKGLFSTQVLKKDVDRWYNGADRGVLLIKQGNFTCERI